MAYDLLDRHSNHPGEIECGHDGCTEMAWLVEDEGAGYCTYECPTHGSFGVQFDDDEDDYDPELDFGFEVDPYEPPDATLLLPPEDDDQ